MVLSLLYRRPTHVSLNRASSMRTEKSKSIGGSTVSSQSSGVIAGISQALSFDRIVSNGACPPCTVRDFMNYLIYIEHAAENLQFYLWYQAYVKRFHELPMHEQGLAPVWTPELADVESKNNMTHSRTTTPARSTTHASSKSMQHEPSSPNLEIVRNPFNTPPQTPSGVQDEGSVADKFWSDSGSTLAGSAERGNSVRKGSSKKMYGVRPVWGPFTMQPYREEITRILAIYVADGSPRQLNLSARERSNLLQALTSTTHPSAFQPVVKTVEWSLRHQAHPNFIRWTICNGNRPRVVFARGLGLGSIIFGIITIILIILSDRGRAWRILSAPLFVFGISTLIAAWKGMCVVLHGLHHRHLRPWELFADPDDENSASFNMSRNSFSTYNTDNSYEDEPWVAKYEQRNILRKIFDRQVWIQEPALRQIQDTIFLQAVLSSLVLSIAIVGALCAIPRGTLY